MKKSLCILFITLCLAPLGGAEITDHRLSMNLGGPMSVCSFEYEYEFYNNEKVAFLFTGGVGSLIIGYSTPIGISYTYGDKNQLLLGVQYVPYYVTNRSLGSLFSPNIASQWIHTFSPRLGIRKIFKLNKEMAYIQVFLSPVIHFDVNGVLASGGIGFGVYL